jgi:hypothetical protein
MLRRITMTIDATLPAGRYWIGDLCYVMHGLWDAFCDLTLSGPDVADGPFTLNDQDGWFHTTAYGDGFYGYDLHNLPDDFVAAGGFGVDAGLIGIIPMALVGKDEDDDSALGVIIEFKKPVRCNYMNGIFVFTDGDIGIQIYTNDD